MSIGKLFRDIFAPESVIYDGAADTQFYLSPPPKPRLAAVKHAPSRDEFRAWRDDPVTQFVMAGLTRNAEECREEWVTQSWGTGTADPLKLTGLRERADALLGFVECSYEGWCETLGVEPEANDAA